MLARARRRRRRRSFEYARSNVHPRAAITVSVWTIVIVRRRVIAIIIIAVAAVIDRVVSDAQSTDEDYFPVTDRRPKTTADPQAHVPPAPPASRFQSKPMGFRLCHVCVGTCRPPPRVCARALSKSHEIFIGRYRERAKLGISNRRNRSFCLSSLCAPFTPPFVLNTFFDCPRACFGGAKDISASSAYISNSNSVLCCSARCNSFHNTSDDVSLRFFFTIIHFCFISFCRRYFSNCQLLIYTK